MAKKCVHKGCGKTYENEDEECVYHPGPPVFHEGQKGWKCCKPRVLTFDEFLTIPPCTTGTHSDVDDTPAPEPTQAPDVPTNTQVDLGSLQESLPAPVPRLPAAQSTTPQLAASPKPPEESEDDDPSLEVKQGMTCRRRGCGQKSEGGDREGESCVHHPGAPIFHEGSKGWSCCKRRVLEFDQFMNIEGCKTKNRHLFVGSGKKGGEEKVETVRNDFYQTATSVIASLYLKKIDKDSAKVVFHADHVDLDLRTSDSKRYAAEFPLFASIKPEDSKYRILGTKLELTLVKADGAAWPVLRSDDKPTGEMIQVGRAGRV
ncbi:chord-domain-containing protein [Karstenula rhodostoma CBS 690.94]|uniref:Chord-domain-containing protein n=1 Tax=Karstenula rhodostoma CBS 690.94 TaxID=1392251 RepID=A0A9P4PMH7_9PLEO|nr:chord-domain-containing protein [Karstenula rhodostoma CBS 690.94]